MNSDASSKLSRLREAVYDLQEQVDRTPPQARSAVEEALLSVLGVEYATHVVSRLAGTVEHIARQHIEQNETYPVS